MTRQALSPIVVVLALACAGCAAIDPYKAPGLWRPNAANAADLAAEAARPEDFVRGRGAPGGDGQLAGAAVARLRRDQVKALPDVSISQIGATGGGGSSSSSSGGGGAEQGP